MFQSQTTCPETLENESRDCRRPKKNTKACRPRERERRRREGLCGGAAGCARGMGLRMRRRRREAAAQACPSLGDLFFMCKITHKITCLRCIYTSVRGYTCIGVFSLTAQAPGLREPAQTQEHCRSPRPVRAPQKKPPKATALNTAPRAAPPGALHPFGEEPRRRSPSPRTL